MAHEVKDRETLKEGQSSYLFFTQPPALWQGDTSREEHKTILYDSRRKKHEIAVAGGLSVYFADRIQVVVDGVGSHGLEFPKKNSEVVADFIKNLSGIEPERVGYWEQPR